jgi:hypothetical protein
MHGSSGPTTRDNNAYIVHAWLLCRHRWRDIYMHNHWLIITSSSSMCSHSCELRLVARRCMPRRTFWRASVLAAYTARVYYVRARPFSNSSTSSYPLLAAVPSLYTVRAQLRCLGQFGSCRVAAGVQFVNGIAKMQINPAPSKR